MGRPREHDQATRRALRAAAAELVAEGGADALSVRTVAVRAQTTTRAVYSLFGSKQGLVAALAEEAFAFLDHGLARLPETADPAADLIDAGVTVYRRFVCEHPALFRIAFQRIVPGFELGPELLEARARAWTRLQAKVARLEEAGVLGDLPVDAATVAFNAMCEGLGNAELRGGTLRVLPKGEEARAWRECFESLVRGFAHATIPPPAPRSR